MGSEVFSNPAQGTREAVTAYVALGANLGDASAALAGAVLAIHRLPGTRLGACSSIYRTAPIGVSGLADGEQGHMQAGTELGPDYFNAVVEIQTRLSAPALLDALQAIEGLAGRERPYINAPRTLDLDIALYGEGSIASPRLTVPHPRMWQRAFVLVPLAEIAPHKIGAFALVSVRHQAIEKLGPLPA